MTDELKFPGNGPRDHDSLDESLTSLIREAYAPPGGDAYWGVLEQRIMSRVASENVAETPWWNVLAPWARPALIAAAAIFALASVVNQQIAVDSDSQVSYDSVMQSVTPEVVATSEELSSVSHGADGAALSYFLSH